MTDQTRSSAARAKSRDRRAARELKHTTRPVPSRAFRRAVR